MNSGSDAQLAIASLVECSDEAEAFRHEPLDHTKPSIRLLELLPDLSPNGSIQCRIFHTTTDASYTCLSYVWGRLNQGKSRTILLNGYRCIVRKNLFDFLQFMQANPTHDVSVRVASAPRIYWIDALCIDQTSIAERNHQVAQMGQIYASAKLVHIWLGRIPDEYSLCWLIGDERNSIDSIDCLDWLRRPYPYNHFMTQYIFWNQYWKRAWVTQEIVLAQAVVVSIGSQLMSLFDLLSSVREFPQFQDTAHLRQFSLSSSAVSEMRGKGLVYLMSHFRDKECSVPQDRVFSLLSLSHEGYRVEVDYGTPGLDLAAQILSITPETLCFCSAATVARSLNLQPNGSNMAGTTKTMRPWLDVYVSGLVLKRNNWYVGSPIRERKARAFHASELNFRFKDPTIITEWSPNHPYSGDEPRLGSCLDQRLVTVVDKIVKSYSYHKSQSIFPKYGHLISFSEAFSEYTWNTKTWRGDQAGKLTVYNKQDNVCIIRISLSALGNYGTFKDELCPSPKPWQIPNHDCPIKAIKITYDY